MIEDEQREEETALSYVDEYGSKEQKQVEILIREEMKTIPTTTEEEKKTQTQTTTTTTTMLNMKEWMSMGVEPKGEERKKKEEWERATKRVETQVEMQKTRRENLELLEAYGANTWLQYVKRLEEINKEIQREVDNAQRRVRELNGERKAEQMKAMKKLEKLHEQFLSAVSKNEEIERVCQDLESQQQ